MAPINRNSTTSNVASATSKSLSKNKIVPKNKFKGVSISLSYITNMLLDDGLAQHSTFKVPPSGSAPTTITPIKANGGGHSNINLDENGEVVVEVGLTESNEEVDTVGDRGKADGSTDNSTKTDEEDGGLLVESGGAEDDGMDVDVAANVTATEEVVDLTGGKLDSDGLKGEDDLSMDNGESKPAQDNDSHDIESL